MLHRVKDLSPDQRVAIEALLGRRLEQDEGLNIQPSRILKEAPTGEERATAARQYLAHLDFLAQRAQDVPLEQREAVIDEACRRAKHRSE